MVSFSDLTPNSKTGNVPLIGDLIPSRWSYEALAVTVFTDNDYERPYFEMDKERQETQFYNMGFLYELQSQLETMNDEAKRGQEVNPKHLSVIRTNLPVITEYCGMEPYTGDYKYQSLFDYMKKAEKILSERGNKVTLKKDAMIKSIVRQQGKDAVFEVKKNNYNSRLEEFVTGADNRRMLDIVDDHIVPRTGIIYLTPHNKIGRAPFYSSEKILGTWHIKTLWFNMGVIGLMGIIAIILLLTDCPGRYLRRES